MFDSELLSLLEPVTEEELLLLNGQATVNHDLYMGADPQIITSGKLIGGNRQIALRPHTRFVDFPLHAHDYIEMVYVCSGQLRQTVNHRELLMKPGELLILGRGAWHEIRKASAQDIAVNFLIEPSFFSGMMDYSDIADSQLKTFLMNCLCGNEGSSFLYFRCADNFPVQNLIENMIWMHFHKKQSRTPAYQRTMGLIMFSLLDASDLSSSVSGANPTMMKVLNYIESRYVTASLKEAAETVNYEVTGLSKLIRQQTGRTFTELLQDKRLTSAAWLLRETDATIADIAASVGYANFSFFHRLFLKRYGMTPRKYRISK